MRPRIFFIAGTDTGVGKTVLTGLLLSHLRQTGHRALALKPFCSGGRADAELLHELQDGELALDEINPFHFKEPLAPLVAARLHRRKVPLASVLDHIRSIVARLAAAEFKVQDSKFKVQSSPPVLLIEGAGGLLSPLGETPFKVQGSKFKVQSSVYSSLHLIEALECPVLLVAANRLGTINHVLLTVHKLQSIGIQDIKIVLMDVSSPRRTACDGRYNLAIIQESLSPLPVLSVPYLGRKPCSPKCLNTFAKRLKATLARILD